MSDPNMKVCPRCLTDYSENSAKSKLDNETEICNVCSLEESMIEWFNIKLKASEIPGEVMERETKFSNMIFQKSEKK